MLFGTCGIFSNNNQLLFQLRSRQIIRGISIYSVACTTLLHQLHDEEFEEYRIPLPLHENAITLMAI